MQNSRLKDAGILLVVAVIGLITGVIGTQQVRDSIEKVLNQALKYAEASLKDAVDQKLHKGDVLVERNLADRPTVENLTKLSADVRNIIHFAEELAPKPIERLTGSVSNNDLKLLKFVQKAGDDGAHEFIELQVLRPINLSNGQIGDAKQQPGSSKALKLPAKLNLNSGDKLRIFTTEDFNPFRVVEPG